MLDKRLHKHMEYLTSIVRNEARDVNGLPPTLADRIAAGGCLVTIHTIIENGFDLDTEKSIAECRKVYGDRWSGPDIEEG